MTSEQHRCGEPLPSPFDATKNATDVPRMSDPEGAVIPVVRDSLWEDRPGFHMGGYQAEKTDFAARYD